MCVCIYMCINSRQNIQSNLNDVCVCIYACVCKQYMKYAIISVSMCVCIYACACTHRNSCSHKFNVEVKFYCCA